MPIQHAVLALLADQPSHGYQLRAAFEETVGPEWGGLNIGHLYQVLDRLTRDELVSSTHVSQATRPDRRVYELTDAGRTALRTWLEEPTERTGGFRDDFVLKLLAAARLGTDEVLQVVARQRRHELARLKSLDALSREHRSSALAGLLLDAALLHSRANLELVERAEGRAEALVTSVDRSASLGSRAAEPAEPPPTTSRTSRSA